MHDLSKKLAIDSMSHMAGNTVSQILWGVGSKMYTIGYTSSFRDYVFN